MADTPSQRFEIVPRPEDGLIYIRLWGFWKDPEADAYKDAMTSAMRAMHERGKPWSVVGDISQSPPQAQRNQALRQGLLEEATKLGMQRVAYVTSSPLTALQMQRLARAAKCEVACFDTLEAAEKWAKP